MHVKSSKLRAASTAFFLSLASLGGCAGGGSETPFYEECEATGHSYEECDRVAESHWDMQPMMDLDSEYGGVTQALQDPMGCIDCHGNRDSITNDR